MTLTINSIPQLYTPSDNPVVFRFSSDQTANANFIYYIEVYVNGILKGTHLVATESGIYAHFDATDYASIACATPTMGSSFAASAANNAEIYIKVYERYGTPPSNQASATSTTITVFKAGLSDKDFVNFTYSDYTYATSKKWLSLFPSSERYLCSLTEEMWSMFITNNAVGLFLEVELYDEDGMLIIADSGALGGNYKITIIDTSPASIIANTGVTSAQFDDCYYYEFWLDNGTGATEKFRVYVDRTCDKYITKRFLFLSSIGSIEAFSYTLATEETRDIKRYSFETQFGGFDDSNNYVFSTSEGRQKDYLITSTGKMTVNSDWITQDLYLWLTRELLETPFVLMQYEGDTYRIRLLNSTYKVFTRRVDTIFNSVIEVGLSDARKSVTI